MSGIDWPQILADFESTKVKDRVEAVERFRVYLSSERHFRRLVADRSHSWSETLQSLFGLVVTERTAAVTSKAGKPSAPAQKRVEEATSLVAWTIEKVQHLLKKKAVKAVIAHLTQMLIVRGVVQTYAITYLRALRSVISHQPHLEHLEDKQWVEIVSVCFAGALGDKIEIGQKFRDDEMMDVDIGEPLGQPLRQHDVEDQAFPATRRTASLTETEMMRCIEAVFQCPSSPFLTYSRIIFSKFHRFLRQFKSDTAAHQPTIIALNLVFAAVELNDQVCMRTVGMKLWPYLLDLWPTKNAALKEQLVMALRFLLPFTTPLDGDFYHANVSTRLEPLYQAILGESVLRWREAYDLNLDELRIGLVAAPEKSGATSPFSLSTIRAGAGFSDKSAMAWATLELGADVLSTLHDNAGVPLPDLAPAEDSPRKKRRKIEEPLVELVASLSDPATSGSALVFRCQLLLFIVETHWASFHQSLYRRALSALTSLLSHQEVQAQCWALLVLAAIAQHDVPEDSATGMGRPKRATEGGRGTWDQIWTTTLRRMVHPELSRAAAHLANVLLAHDRIHLAYLAESVEAFARDLDVQGPQFPSDAVCVFLEWCLSLAASDIRLSQLRLPDKILGWLTTGWDPLAGVNRPHSFVLARSRADPFSPEAFISLVARLCAIPQTPHYSAACLVPDCAIATFMVDRAEMRPLREYIAGSVPEYTKEAAVSFNLRTPASMLPSTATKEDPEHKTERRISLSFHRLLSKLLGDAERNAVPGIDPWLTLSLAASHRHLELSITALVIEGLFALNKRTSSKTTIKASHDLLCKLAASFGLSKWQPHERATLLAGLDCLFVDLPDVNGVSYPVMLDPGVASGIPARELPSRPDSFVPADTLHSFEVALLRQIWKESATMQAVEEIASVLGELLHGLSDNAADPASSTPQATQSSQRLHEAEQTQRDDDFGEIRVATRAAQLSGPENTDRASAAITKAALRCLVSTEMARSGTVGMVRLQAVVDTICATSEPRSLTVAQQLLQTLRAGLVSLSTSQATQLVQHLGGLLTDYALARNETCALVALACVECTTSIWLADHAQEGAQELGMNARELCAWYTSSLQRGLIASWRVRLRFAAFLDTYLSIDRTQISWDVGGVAARSGNNEPILPTAIIPTLLQDPDFRVRFRAAYSAPGLFTFMHENGLNSKALFDDIRNNMAIKLKEYEMTLTHSLAYGNVMIASAQRRRSPYYMLLYIASSSAPVVPQVLAILKGVAARLSLPSHRTLHDYYRRYLVRARERDDLPISPQTVPEIYGYASLSAVREAEIRDAAATLLHKQDEKYQDMFRNLCEVNRRDEPSVAADCLPLAVALALGTGYESLMRGEGTVEDIRSNITRMACVAGAQDAHQADQMLGLIADQIAVEVLAMLHQAEWTVESTKQAWGRDERAHRAFTTMVSLEDGNEIILSEASPPFFDLQTVVLSLRWIETRWSIFTKLPAVFSITRSLLDKASQDPFLDSQHDRLLATAVALALGRGVIKTPAQLRALLENLVPMLCTPELARIVGAPLQWAITEWISLCKSSPNASSELVTAVLNAAHACHKLREECASASDQAVAESVAAFLVTSLQKIHDIDRSSHSAAAFQLWPWKAFDVGSVALDDVLEAAIVPFPHVSRFAIVRTLENRHDIAQYTERGTLLWRLLDALDPKATVSSDDALTLANLMYDASADVEAPGLDVLGEEDKRSNWRGKVVANEVNLEAIITAVVLDCTHKSDRALAHRAFETAMMLCSVPSAAAVGSAVAQLGEVDPVASIVLEAASARPQRLRVAPTRSLAERLIDDGWNWHGSDYERWIRDITEVLLDCRAEGEPFYAQLVPLVQADAAVAAILFPLVVHSLLLQAATVTNLDTRMSLTNYLNAVIRAEGTDKRTLKAIVDMAVYLRRHPRPDLANQLTNHDLWLGIPWLLLASAAVTVDAFPTALLFLELAHEYEGLFRTRGGGAPFDKGVDARGQELLYRIYAGIDEPDGFYGRESTDTREALLRRLKHEGRWSEALGIYGAEYEGQLSANSTGLSSSTAGVAQSLSSSGFPRLAMSILQPARAAGIVDDQDLDPGLSYDLAWRTNTWDLPIEARSSSRSSAALYSALRAAQSSVDVKATRVTSESALVSEVKKLGSVSVNLPRPDPEALVTVLALRDVHRLSSLKVGDQLDPDLAAGLHVTPMRMRSHHAEQVLATRISILRGIRLVEEAETIGSEFTTALYGQTREAERACLLCLSRIARASNHLQMSLNAVTAARKLLDAGSKDEDVDQEFAEVLWQKGEHSTAITLLQSSSSRIANRKALVLARLGEWVMAARRRSPRDILQAYFDPAVACLDDSYSSADRGTVFASFAAFADAQFEDLSTVLKEKEERFSTYKQRKYAEFEAIDRQLNERSSSGPSASDLKKSRKSGASQLEEDEKQLQAAAVDVNDMRKRAVENYGKALAESDDHDDKMLRFVALWLAHADNDEVSRDVNTLVKSIPSYKFVFLAYQLSARLSKPAEPTEFSLGIHRLILRLCTDHPFHSIFPVNGSRDTPSPASSPGGKARSRRSSLASSEMSSSSIAPSRAQAAEDIIAKVKKGRPSAATRIQAIELVCDAYREWAEYDLQAWGQQRNGKSVVSTSVEHTMPPHILLLSKVRNLPIPISTIEIPVDVSCRYEEGTFPSIAKYFPTFRNAGGVNMPKIIKCQGSDGQTYKELVKGRDDIRQDAVMQQVFALVNKMLARDEVTRRRKLHVRTYKVIPLQNANGIIEFVSNTKPLVEILKPLYDNSAVQLKPQVARHKLFEAPVRKPELRLKVFKRILQDLPPMFRHFFFREHKLPSLWFDMRLNYSRSVATNSMVGHVLGIGDRHVSNILMDQVRGELVSIDFGIAFEAGKGLAVPETVPFRLTQNLVDGFGSSGVEGVFRRCSEETLRVMRTSSNVIMTVLEVFKHDPLQKWAASAEVVKRIQGSEDGAYGALTDDADRALTVVQNKLDPKLSVEYTVNQLIQEATDVNNLAMIFEGWQPYY